MPLVLKDTPDVLAMGRRCMNEGYTFVWKAHSDKPYFRKPDGTHIVMKVENLRPVSRHKFGRDSRGAG